MSNIAVVGQPGESVTEFMPAAPIPQPLSRHLYGGHPTRGKGSNSDTLRKPAAGIAISPRALNLARRKGIDYQSLSGSGPDGRIIERDIEAAIRERVKVTPVAQAMLSSGEFKLADETQAGIRVSKDDLVPSGAEPAVKAIPLKGARKIIAKRMLESLQTTAQLTPERLC